MRLEGARGSLSKWTFLIQQFGNHWEPQAITAKNVATFADCLFWGKSIWILTQTHLTQRRFRTSIPESSCLSDLFFFLPHLHFWNNATLVSIHFVPTALPTARKMFFIAIALPKVTMWEMQTEGDVSQAGPQAKLTETSLPLTLALSKRL